MTCEVPASIVRGRVLRVFLRRGALGVPKARVSVPEGVTSNFVHYLAPKKALIIAIKRAKGEVVVVSGATGTVLL